MRLEIIVGGWEHECCGPEIERYQRVEWTCVTEPDGRLSETHHDLENIAVTPVHGTIVDLELVLADGSRTGIDRIPSGRALCGSDEHDDGVVRAAYTDEVLDASSCVFMVTVEVASES